MQLAYDVAKTREHALSIPIKPYAPVLKEPTMTIEIRLAFLEARIRKANPSHRLQQRGPEEEN